MRRFDRRGAARSASDGPSAAHLFVASNVGQVRNAARVVHQLRLTDARLMVLWTAHNVDLRERMLRCAAVSGLEAVAFELPNSPTDNLPHKVRRVAALYDVLALESDVGTLWVANTNRHYGYLARCFKARGATVSYFEEGLGTYRMADEEPFSRPGGLEAVRRTATEVSRSLRAPSLSPPMRCRRAAHRVVHSMCGTAAGRWINQIVTSGRSGHFDQPWTDFDLAVVTFPAALDRRLFNAARVVELLPPDIDGLHDSAEQARQWLSRWGVRPLEALPLFLSQTYDVAPAPWGRAIATVVRTAGHDRVIIKFHPRDAPSTKIEMVQAMTTAGLSVVTDPELDGWPAEPLIAAGLATDVLGLTSSTLVFGALDSLATCRSLAHSVLDVLRCDPLVDEADLRRFASDVRLFDRIAAVGEGKTCAPA